MKSFEGYHSEWNLGSPGGWDYQRMTQIIGKAVWKKLNAIRPMGLDLDFDHPMFSPVSGFVDMLAEAHRAREGANPGLIAVVAEEETLEDVTENKNLSKLLSAVGGLTGVLTAPHTLEVVGGKVCHNGCPVSVIFVDFNTDVLLDLHRRQGLSPLLQAVKEGRVLNPRGTEPINAKSMFEVVTDPANSHRFHEDIIRRTPWTRQFYPRKTRGPAGEPISDLIRWTRDNWDALVLKPERGYSGKGVRVGTVNPDVDEAVGLALAEGNYIVQEKIPLNLWAEDVPDMTDGRIERRRFQTDFRCLVGPGGLIGFMGRFGGVPTNVGSGGGLQPLAVLQSGVGIQEAAERINRYILDMPWDAVSEVVDMQNAMAVEHEFTYLLGPVRIALRPRLITAGQLEALSRYGAALWADCLTMEKMWLSGELDHIVKIEDEELEIARMQPWGGSPAIIASDGLFNFGAAPGEIP